MAGLQPEFAKRNCKIIGLSVDPVSNHSKWADDIEETQGHKVNYPMIGDTDLKVAKLYGMLPAGSGNTSEGRTAADNATVFATQPMEWELVVVDGASNDGTAAEAEKECARACAARTSTS